MIYEYENDLVQPLSPIAPRTLPTTETDNHSQSTHGSSSFSLTRQALIDRFLGVRPVMMHCLNSIKSPEVSASLAKVTVHQLEALHLISRGRLTMSELARAMDISESAATALIDRLVAQNLVERFSDSGDRRMVKVGLSCHAEQIIAQIEENRRYAVGSLLSVLDDERLTTLVELLETIAAHATASLDACPSAASRPSA